MKNKILKIFIGLFMVMPCISYGVSYSGNVKDSTGEGLPWAELYSRTNKAKGCTTDIDGNFNCSDLPDNRVTVMYVGFESKDVDLKTSGNDITLIESNVSINEVTIVENAEGTKCRNGSKYIKEGVYQKISDELVCVPTECFDNYEISEDENSCIEKKQPEKQEKSEEKPETKPESKPEPKPKPKPKERTDEEKAAALAEKKSAWDDAKESEQSVANRTLTAATTAATGIGAMQLAQGLTEQKADAAADRDMTAYMATMRCSYADGKSVKAGAEEIELPGGNDANIMQYRNEYFALASSLKERKESLGMKPGIESEAILDKADMGLYDDENVGISGGNYASLYRAKTGSEADQALITSEQEKSANRVKYGGIALGAGASVGIVGNSLINGKLGEWIKGAKDDKDSKKNEDAALKKLKQCMKDAGAKNYDKLKFDNFTPSVLNLDGIDCKKDLPSIKGKDATTLFADSSDGNEITTKLVESFGEGGAATMLGKVVGTSGTSVYVEPTPETVEYTTTGGVKQTRFESDMDYGDGTGYCYNFIDGFVRGNISGAGCSSLEPGDWMTSFENGNVRGVSVCSTVRPDNMPHGFTPDTTVQQQIQNSYNLWVNNGRLKPANDAKTACYCKMNGGGKWVFDSYFSGYSCRSACAYFCAYLVGNAGQQTFREAVLKK